MANSRNDNWFRETDLAVGAARSGRVLDCGHCEPRPPEPWAPPVFQPEFNGSQVVVGFVAGASSATTDGCTTTGAGVGQVAIGGDPVPIGTWLTPAPGILLFNIASICDTGDCVDPVTVFSVVIFSPEAAPYLGATLTLYTDTGQLVTSGVLGEDEGILGLANLAGPCLVAGATYYVTITPQPWVPPDPQPDFDGNPVVFGFVAGSTTATIGECTSTQVGVSPAAVPPAGAFVGTPPSATAVVASVYSEGTCEVPPLIFTAIFSEATPSPLLYDGATVHLYDASGVLVATAVLEWIEAFGLIAHMPVDASLTDGVTYYVTVTPLPDLFVLSGTPPVGEVDSPYAFIPTITGGTSPFTFAGSTTAPGLAVDPALAVTGTPTTAGTYSLTITATDDDGLTSPPYTALLVVGPLPPPPPPQPLFDGNPVVFSFVAQAGVVPDGDCTYDVIGLVAGDGPPAPIGTPIGDVPDAPFTVAVSAVPTGGPCAQPLGIGIQFYGVLPAAAAYEGAIATLHAAGGAVLASGPLVAEPTPLGALVFTEATPTTLVPGSVYYVTVTPP